jgi:predicted nucleotide-binding protein
VKESELKPRARQNVILELGYFWGSLGRSRIFTLIKGEIELPSDIYGIFTHRFEEKVEEIQFDNCPRTS